MSPSIRQILLAGISLLWAWLIKPMANRWFTPRRFWPQLHVYCFWGKTKTAGSDPHQENFIGKPIYKADFFGQAAWAERNPKLPASPERSRICLEKVGQPAKLTFWTNLRFRFPTAPELRRFARFDRGPGPELCAFSELNRLRKPGFQ